MGTQESKFQFWKVENDAAIDLNLVNATENCVRAKPGFPARALHVLHDLCQRLMLAFASHCNIDVPVVPLIDRPPSLNDW
jgi:hypothetical protein